MAKAPPESKVASFEDKLPADPAIGISIPPLAFLDVDVV